MGIYTHLPHTRGVALAAARCGCAVTGGAVRHGDVGSGRSRGARNNARDEANVAELQNASGEGAPKVNFEHTRVSGKNHQNHARVSGEFSQITKVEKLHAHWLAQCKRSSLEARGEDLSGAVVDWDPLRRQRSDDLRVRERRCTRIKRREEPLGRITRRAAAAAR